jgi:hypothetical protein
VREVRAKPGFVFSFVRFLLEAERDRLRKETAEKVARHLRRAPVQGGNVARLRRAVTACCTGIHTDPSKLSLVTMKFAAKGAAPLAWGSDSKRPMSVMSRQTSVTLPPTYWRLADRLTIVVAFNGMRWSADATGGI